MIPKEGLHPPVEGRIMSKSQGPAPYVSEPSQQMPTAGTRRFGGLEGEGPLYGPGRAMVRWVQGRSEGGKKGKLPTLDAPVTLRMPSWSGASGVQVTTVSVTSGLKPKGASQSLWSPSPPGGHIEKCITLRKSDHKSV